MSKKIKLSNLHFDEKNFNIHTEEGLSLLEKSVKQQGVLESITVSSDDKVISGNARKKVIEKLLKDKEAIVIDTDGSQPVILRRTDIKSGTKKFHESALLANTVSNKNLNLDQDLIKEVLVEEYGVEDLEELGVTVYDFTDEDLEHFFKKDDEEPTGEEPIKGSKENKQLILEYNKDEYDKVMEAIKKRGSIPEQVIWNVLNLD